MKYFAKWRNMAVTEGKKGWLYGILGRHWFLLNEEDTMEQIPHVGTETFTEHFMTVLSAHWSDIMYVLNRQSPRIAALLHLSYPSSMKRLNGGWQIYVVARKPNQPERLRQPRDNEIVAHAIRSLSHSSAQFNLPPVTFHFH